MRFVTRLAAVIAYCALGGVAPAGNLGKLNYNVEWRLIRAGTVSIDAGEAGGHVKIDSAGLVSTLFKVDDIYTVRYAPRFCVSESTLDAREGSRHRQTTVTYDRERGRATLTERDLVKNEVRGLAQTEVPPCVHEVLGAILALRGSALEPGQSTLLPVSNGRRSAQVKVEAQEREGVTTPAGVFKTIRYEASLMNGVIYQRSGRVFLWFTDDEKRTPVQIRLRLSFPIGTVTLQLQKEESK